MFDWFPVFVKLSGVGLGLTYLAMALLFFGMLGTLIEGHGKFDDRDESGAKEQFTFAWLQFALMIALVLVGFWWTVAVVLGVLALGVLYLLISSLKAFLPSSPKSSSSSQSSKSTN